MITKLLGSINSAAEEGHAAIRGKPGDKAATTAGQGAALCKIEEAEENKLALGLPYGRRNVRGLDAQRLRAFAPRWCDEQRALGLQPTTNLL